MPVNLLERSEVRVWVPPYLNLKPEEVRDDAPVIQIGASRVIADMSEDEEIVLAYRGRGISQRFWFVETCNRQTLQNRLNSIVKTVLVLWDGELRYGEPLWIKTPKGVALWVVLKGELVLVGNRPRADLWVWDDADEDILEYEEEPEPFGPDHERAWLGYKADWFWTTKALSYWYGLFRGGASLEDWCFVMGLLYDNRPSKAPRIKLDRSTGCLELLGAAVPLERFWREKTLTTRKVDDILYPWGLRLLYNFVIKSRRVIPTLIPVAAFGRFRWCNYHQIWYGTEYFSCPLCWLDRNVSRRRRETAFQIHRYSYKPEPKFIGKGRIFYGAELEYHDVRCKKILNMFKNNENDDIAERIYLKRDSSLRHGVEIVTHPMTLDAWRDGWLERLVAELDKASPYRKGGGLHVHVTRTFDDVDKRFAIFWNYITNEGFVKKIAGRPPRALKRWARCGWLYPADIRKWDLEVPNRYVACNVTETTLEVRVFKNDRSPERIYAAVELVAACRKLAEESQRLALWHKELVDYIMDNRQLYPHAVWWLETVGINR